MPNPESALENETHKVLLDFEIQNGPPNLGQTTRSSDSQQKKKKKKRKKRKKKLCRIEDFADKLKESEKKDKYQDLTGESKNLSKMKVTVIPIVFRTLGTSLKELVKKLEDLKIRGQVETIQTTALLRSARILRRVLET